MTTQSRKLTKSEELWIEMTLQQAERDLMPRVFTPEQARYAGITQDELPEDWFYELKSVGEGQFDITPIYKPSESIPEWGLEPGQKYTYEDIETRYQQYEQQRLEQEQQYAQRIEDITPYVHDIWGEGANVTQILQRASEGSGDFLKELREKGTREQQEAFLTIAGASEEDITGILGPSLLDISGVLAVAEPKKYARYSERYGEDAESAARRTWNWVKYNAIDVFSSSGRSSITNRIKDMNEEEANSFVNFLYANADELEEEYNKRVERRPGRYDKPFDIDTLIREIAPVRAGSIIELQDDDGNSVQAWQALNGDIYNLDISTVLARWDEKNNEYDVIGRYPISIAGIPVEVPYKVPSNLSGWQKAGFSFVAGVGDILQMAGGIFKWVGNEPEVDDGIGLQEKLWMVGEQTRILGELGSMPANIMPDNLGSFKWEHLGRSDWWATRFVRQVPFTLATIPAGIVGGLAGGQVAKGVSQKVGNKFLQQVILKTTPAATAGLTQRTIESALEAGATYNMARQQNMNDEQASDAAMQTFRNNMKLVGSDAAQWGMAFAPIGGGTTKGLIRSGLVNATTIGGKLTIGGLTEAGEEYYQEIVQRQALGEDISAIALATNLSDSEIQEVMVLGGMMGIGFQLGGVVVGNLQSRIIDRIPSSMRSAFDADVALFEASGLSHEEAVLAALDNFSETTEGKQIIEQVVQEETVEANRGQVVGVTEEEQLGWDEHFQTQKKEARTKYPLSPQNKLIEMIDNWIPLRVETEALKSEELSRRAALMESSIQRTRGEDTLISMYGALRGELPKAQFEAREYELSGQEQAELYNQIWDSSLDVFDKLNAAKALRTVFNNTMPTDGEIATLENFFGPEIGKALRKKWPLKKKAMDLFLDVVNLPRAVNASWDMSAPLRQGGPVFIGQYKQTIPALWPQVRAFFSDVYVKRVDSLIKASRWADVRKKAGLYLAPIEGGMLNVREETFISRLSKYIPLVKASERAYITYLNKIRADIFDFYASAWEESGKEVNWNDYKELAKFINRATGRGDLGRFSQNGPLLSGLFFSPRLQLARVKLPLSLVSSSPAVRKIAARNIATFVASNAIVLSLVELSGMGGVERDPRSSDFAKIRLGNTRLDPWGGFQQYARLVANLITSQGKTQAGRIIEKNRFETITNFLRSKESPPVGLIHDVLDGATYIGEDMELESDFVIEQIYNRLTPFFIQDMFDTIAEKGMPGGLCSLPGFFGVGVQTYPDALEEITNQLGVSVPKDDPRYKEDEDQIYKANHLYSDIRRLTQGMTPDQVRDSMSYTTIVKAIVEAGNLWDEVYGDENMFSNIDNEEDRQKARSDWLISHPEENAKLALWGKTKTLTREAYERMYELAEELGIPENCIPEQIAPRELAPSYFEYMDKVTEYGGSSVQVALAKAENPELFEWGAAQFGWESEGRPVEALRLRVQYDDQWDLYDSYGDKTSKNYIADSDARAEARDRLMTGEFATAYYKYEAYLKGADDVMADLHSEYSILSTQAEKNLFRIDHSVYDSWRLDVAVWGSDTMEAVEKPRRYYEIQVDYAKEFDEYEATDGVGRSDYLDEHPSFKKAYYELGAISSDITRVGEYVEWYTNYSERPDDISSSIGWYEDDWWLMEHTDFEREMVEKGVWKEVKDYSKVPTRQVYEQWVEYNNLRLSDGSADSRARQAYRRNHKELEAWLQTAKGYGPLQPGSASTPWR